MKYNFDQIIDRKNSGSLKWDYCDKYFASDDLLPMWVADMDFPAPQPVIDAVTEKAAFGIYGYGEASESYFAAVSEWSVKKHNWPLEREWLFFSPGVVPALHWIVTTFTEPGDKVMLQSPVYYPFFTAIRNGDCEVVNSPLVLIDGSYGIDFDHFTAQIDERVKLFFLCSPHNPGGMVWSKEELTMLGKICSEHNVIVVSDEIHCDLTLYGNTHLPFASLCEQFAQNSITCTAPSKTFNLAGLQASNVIIPNRLLADKFKASLQKSAVSRPNLFALTAGEAAYRYGEEWLEQVIVYLEENHQLLEEYIAEKIPDMRVVKPQATYLSWLDCRDFGLSTDQLKDLVTHKAKLALSQGYIFGPGGEGFLRINLGCPRSLVLEALKRLEQVFSTLGQ